MGLARPQTGRRQPSTVGAAGIRESKSPEAAARAPPPDGSVLVWHFAGDPPRFGKVGACAAYLLVETFVICAENGRTVLLFGLRNTATAAHRTAAGRGWRRRTLRIRCT